MHNLEKGHLQTRAAFRLHDREQGAALVDIYPSIHPKCNYLYEMGAEREGLQAALPDPLIGPISGLSEKPTRAGSQRVGKLNYDQELTLSND